MPGWWTSVVTLLALLVHLAVTSRVSAARQRHGVEAPRTTGHPEFERVFRVQQNTTEQLVVFIPALWLASAVVADPWPALVGLLWVAGRVVYAAGYYRAAAARGPGMLMTMAATVLLILMAAIGLALRARF